MSASTHQPIPITLLTGFLGSGKTTLLNGLVRQPAMSRTLVIINEFGEIPLDHQLFSATEDIELVTLDSGCLCCAVRGDLVRTLRDLPGRFSRGGQRFFDRVVIETTGLADPAPILHTLMSEPRVARTYRLDSVVTTVDSVHGEASLSAHFEAKRQVAMADRLLLTKDDLAGTATRTALHERLAALNPGARCIAARDGHIDAGEVFGLDHHSGAETAAALDRWLAEPAPTMTGLKLAEPIDTAPASPRTGSAVDKTPPPHDTRIRTDSYVLDTPIARVRLQTWLEFVLSVMGERMLRIKGLLNLADETAPTVLHGVQHILHPLTELPEWPDDDRRSRLVFITCDVPRHTLDNLMAALY
ncbi:GTP-binding protein [Salinisphaera sp. Q1T1-3]|uniref:CobW family GTP-binding protein n=1 Tax=Salinisphaera sp. Q1T1-3 TaxID=2321229 RepID=UPI000E73F27F|nr:GTP-binding protein [Salinisphaera sp. Q1T1-3]RJS93234.1 GTP-binding protein [Salinisphaera sp. Q1T1-3]